MKESPKSISIFVVAFFILGIVLAADTVKRKLHEENAPAASDEEKVRFWKNNIQPIVEKIRKEDWGIPQINSRHRELAGKIIRQYGKPYDIEIAINFGTGERKEDTDWLLGLSFITNGVPTIRIYIPTAVRLLEGLYLTKDPDWQTHFVYAIAIAYFHELDHLSERLLDEKASKEQKEAFERRASAMTCEHLIRPLVKLGIPLCESDRELYDAWVKCGRNEKSPAWSEMIRKRWNY